MRSNKWAMAAVMVCVMSVPVDSRASVPGIDPDGIGPPPEVPVLEPWFDTNHGPAGWAPPETALPVESLETKHMTLQLRLRVLQTENARLQAENDELRRTRGAENAKKGDPDTLYLQIAVAAMIVFCVVLIFIKLRR